MNTRKELELRITEAVDGRLSDAQLQLLRSQLQTYPDLLSEWELQSSASLLKQVYSQIEPSTFAVMRLRQHLNALNDQVQPVWEVELLSIFRRYVLASGILAICLVGALNWMQARPSALSNEDIVLDEMNSFFNSLEQEAQLWVNLEDNQASNLP